jgi:16S rRNA (uracil1498-N3)-methyltransferase
MKLIAKRTLSRSRFASRPSPTGDRAVRFLLIEPAQLQEDVVFFDRQQSHYLLRVLRKSQGDPLTVIVASKGTALDGRIVLRKRGNLSLEVGARKVLPAPPSPALTLAVGVLKENKLEEVARQATELGVARLALIATERAVPRRIASEGRSGRIEEIVWNACQQSGNPYPPAISHHDSVGAFLEQSSGCRAGLIVAVADSGGGLVDLCIDSHQDQILMVGPEGDFTCREVEQVIGAGGRSLTIAGQILRSETACVVLSTLVLDRMGRLATINSSEQGS